MAETELSEERAEELVRQLSSKGDNVHTFFRDIIASDSTTKTGNLASEELGMPRITLRGIKELELFSRDIFKQDLWAKYFEKLGEIQTATSLSKEGILIKLAVTSKKELADITPEKKKNRGMFGFGRKKEDSA